MAFATMLPALLATFGVLLASAPTAQVTEAQAAGTDSPPCWFEVQLGCQHQDCSEQLGCIRIYCPVYVRHTGHVVGHGCTPP